MSNSSLSESAYTRLRALGLQVRFRVPTYVDTLMALAAAEGPGPWYGTDVRSRDRDRVRWIAIHGEDVGLRCEM